MKSVLITGASRGMGKAMAEKFLNNDWSETGALTSAGRLDINILT